MSNQNASAHHFIKIICGLAKEQLIARPQIFSLNFFCAADADAGQPKIKRSVLSNIEI